MTSFEELRRALALAYDENPARMVEEIVTALSNYGCPTILIGLPEGGAPLLGNSINLDQAGNEAAKVVIRAALYAIGMPRQQANGLADTFAPTVVRAARTYAAQRAARARAAQAAQGRSGP